MPTKQLLIRLQSADHKAVKVAAAHLEISMADLIRQAVREWLKHHARYEAQK